MASFFTPGCLHIPTLYENSVCGVSFEDTNADWYELQQTVNESFEEASIGLPWWYIRQMDNCWADLEEANMSWQDFDVLSFGGSLTTQTGAGAEFAGEDVGLTWAQMDVWDKDWDFLSDGPEWAQLELYSSNGISWNALEAALLSWDGWRDRLEEKNTEWDWDFFAGQPSDAGGHRGFEVTVPEGALNMSFRVRANSDDVFSEYITAPKQDVVSVNTAKFLARPGERFQVRLNADFAKKLAGTYFYLAYPRDRVRFLGETEFGFERKDKGERGWLFDGAVWDLMFEASGNGVVPITVRHINRSGTTVV